MDTTGLDPTLSHPINSNHPKLSGLVNSFLENVESYELKQAISEEPIFELITIKSVITAALDPTPTVVIAFCCFCNDLVTIPGSHGNPRTPQSHAPIPNITGASSELLAVAKLPTTSLYKLPSIPWRIPSADNLRASPYSDRTQKVANTR